MSVAINHEKLNWLRRAWWTGPYEAPSIAGRGFRDVGSAPQACEGRESSVSDAHPRYTLLGSGAPKHGRKWQHKDCGKLFYDFGAILPRCPSCLSRR